MMALFLEKIPWQTLSISTCLQSNLSTRCKTSRITKILGCKRHVVTSCIAITSNTLHSLKNTHFFTFSLSLKLFIHFKYTFVFPFLIKNSTFMKLKKIPHKFSNSYKDHEKLSKFGVLAFHLLKIIGSALLLW